MWRFFRSKTSEGLYTKYLTTTPPCACFQNSPKSKLYILNEKQGLTVVTKAAAEWNGPIRSPRLLLIRKSVEMVHVSFRRRQFRRRTAERVEAVAGDHLPPPGAVQLWHLAVLPHIPRPGVADCHEGPVSSHSRRIHDLPCWARSQGLSPRLCSFSSNLRLWKRKRNDF